MHVLILSFKSIPKNSMIRHLKHQLFRLRARSSALSFLWKSKGRCEFSSSVSGHMSTCVEEYTPVLLPYFFVFPNPSMPTAEQDG